MSKVVVSSSIAKVGLIAVLLLPIASCSNSPVGQSLQDAFAADPRLRSTPDPLAQNSPPPPQNPTQPQTATIALPPKFPTEVPKYPNATLVEVASTGEMPVEQSAELITRWKSPDARDRLIDFYRDELQKNGWQLDSGKEGNSDRLAASRPGLKLAIAVQPTGQNGSILAIETKPDNAQANSQASNGIPQPGSDDFIGPVLPNGNAQPNNVAASPTSSFSDLDKAPQQLRQYLKDVTQLGVLTPAKTKSNASNVFEPNKEITRREYARWLVAANNRVNNSRPARQIRLAVDSAKPTFKDVPATDPDFGAIQGLAEAGLIPSPISGDSTAVLFRPDAALDREDLILWKIPVDTRQVLPTATIDAVKQTWGFQDAERIDSKALRAVLADYQNGDQSNIRRAFGYTTLFQPKRSVTRAEATAVLWHFGFQGDGVSATEALKG